MVFSDAVQSLRGAFFRYLERAVETLPATGDLIAAGFVPYLDADLYEELVGRPGAGSGPAETGAGDPTGASPRV